MDAPPVAQGDVTSGAPTRALPDPAVPGDLPSRAAARRPRGDAREGKEERPDPLDPLVRGLARPIVEGGAAPAPAAPPSEAAQAAAVEAVAHELVRRIAFGGNARRGTARLELGAGRYAGATLHVEAEGGRVNVRIELAAGAEPDLAERLRTRLLARGLDVGDVDVG